MYGRQAGWQDADDVAQDLSVVLLEKQADIDNVSAYANAVTRNLIVTGIRGAVLARRHDSLNEDWMHGAAVLADTAFERIVVSDQLAEALAQLRPGDREIVARFYLDSQSKEEVMAAMQLSPDQFRLRKMHALARLRTAMHKSEMTGARNRLQALAAAEGYAA
jgi:DNA-directed RNA polymerase specialized sigma24 family protein